MLISDSWKSLDPSFSQPLLCMCKGDVCPLCRLFSWGWKLKEKAWKLPGQVQRPHLLPTAVQTLAFVGRKMAIFLQAVIICTIT